jgi:hypothetical protein
MLVREATKEAFVQLPRRLNEGWQNTPIIIPTTIIYLRITLSLQLY